MPAHAQHWPCWFTATNGRSHRGIVVSLLLLLALLTTPAAAQTNITVEPTPAPPQVVLDVAQSRADLLFTFFTQDATAVQEYTRTLADLLNVTVRRVKFESTGQGRYGYLFGDDVRVRVIIDAPVAAENEQRPAAEVRDALVDLANAKTPRLVDVGVTSGERVDTLFVYTYPVITAWDVVWTLLIVAGGVGFLAFCAFVGFRFHRWYKFAQREKALEAKEKEVAAAKQKATAHGAGGKAAGGKDDKEKEKEKEREAQRANALRFEEDDDDGDVGDEAMQVLIDQLARSVARANGSGDHYGDENSPSPDRAASVAAGAHSEAFTAPTDRIPAAQDALGPTSMHGRDALALHTSGVAATPRAPKSAVLSYLDTIQLPPDNATASSSSDAGSPSRPPAAAPARGPTSAPDVAQPSQGHAAAMAPRRVEIDTSDL